MLLGTVSVALSLATASFATPPLPRSGATEGIFKIKGSTRRGIQKRADGGFDKAFWTMRTAQVAQKYKGTLGTYRNNIQKGNLRRNVETVALTDYISDGTDVEYCDGPIEIGTPGQPVQMDFDTGSSDLWVSSIACIDCTGRRFNPIASSTYTQTLQPFQIVYGSGAVTGAVGADQVSVAGLTVKKQYFGNVNVVTPEFINDPSDGILGLGFPSIASDGQKPFVNSLIDQGSLDSNLFGVYLKHNSVSGSELTIGGIDSSHVSSDFTYTPVTSQGYWEVIADGFMVDGKAAGGSFSAAIDTGTTLIYAPTNIAKAFYSQIPGSAATPSEGDGTYTYPCDFSGIIVLAFNGVSFPISNSAFNIGTSSDDSSRCIGGLMGMDFSDVDEEPLAIVGDLFLIGVYSVFDYNGPRVGFALSRA